VQMAGLVHFLLVKRSNAGWNLEAPRLCVSEDCLKGGGSQWLASHEDTNIGLD
jgi:hypothetical protein